MALLFQITLLFLHVKKAVSSNVTWNFTFKDSEMIKVQNENKMMGALSYFSNRFNLSSSFKAIIFVVSVYPAKNTIKDSFYFNILPTDTKPAIA